MEYFKDGKYYLAIGGNTWGVWNQKDELLFADTEKNVEIMQYTGLKDKHGREIYEGDIVIDWEYLSKYIVRWNKEWCCFELQCIKKISDTSIEITDLTTCKVIGNVYENPELLEK